MGNALSIFLIGIILILVVVIFTGKLPILENLLANIPNILQNTASTPFTNLVPQTAANQSTYFITTPQINQSQLAGYALNLINNDRQQYGLAPVTLSTEPSAQQHAESMLYYDYFSHWDIYDMKPYMRYTLVGGQEGVSENIAYQKGEVCEVSFCSGDINPQNSLQNMEYDMMYNDSVCCQNGHRDNILDPNHNQVSIGIAYNKSAIYFVEDFIDDYINWGPYGPVYTSAGEMYLNGSVAQGYKVDQIYVSYDAQVTTLAPSQTPSGPYGFGDNIAGVVSNGLYYYQGIKTIVADTYSLNGNEFNINFNINSLIQQYGAGEYTVELLLNSTSTGKSLLGSSYTIFINSTGKQYIPSQI